MLNKKLRTLVISAFLVFCVIGTSFAVVYWAGSLQWGITVTGTEAYLIDVGSPDNYLSQTQAVSLSSSYGDVRDQSVVLAIAGSNVAGDQVLRVEVNGVPDGLGVTAKLGFASYFERYFAIDPSETNIGIFNDAGDWQPVCVIGGVYQTVDFSTMRDLPVSINGANPEYGILLGTTDLDHMTYEDPLNASFNIETEPTIEDSNAAWIYFEFDSSSYSGYGDFDLTVNISITDA